MLPFPDFARIRNYVLNDETYEVEGVGRTKHWDAIMKFAHEIGVKTEILSMKERLNFMHGAEDRGKSVTPKVIIEEYYGMNPC